MNDTDILTADAKTFWEVIEALKEEARGLESKWIDTVSSMSEPIDVASLGPGSFYRVLHNHIKLGGYGGDAP
jgi:hypothetical protein